MKNAAIAFGVTIIVCYGLGWAISLAPLPDEGVAQAYQVLFGGAVAMWAYIKQQLDEQHKQAAIRSATRAVPGLADYGLHWYAAAFYASTALFFAREMIAIIFGMVGALLLVIFFGAEAPPEQTTMLALIFAIGGLVTVLPIVAYHIGNWIGRRTRDRSLVTLLLVATAGNVAGVIIDWATLYVVLRERPSSDRVMLGTFAVSVVSLLVFGLLGLWRGRKQRPASYLQYLLDFLPPDTANAGISQAHDEVQALIRGRTVAVSGLSTSPRSRLPDLKASDV
jgi:hypothetical protein